MNITVAVPNTGYIHKAVAEYLLKLSADKKGHTVTFDLCRDVPADQTRNKIIKTFLENEERQDFLFFIDSDNPPLENALELANADLDVVILPTPVWSVKHGRDRSPVYWNCMDWDRNGGRGWLEHQGKKRLPSGVHVAEGLEEIDAGGTGSAMIARRVLEKVKPAFMREYNDDGLITKGSDFYFCQRAQNAGFKIWASYDHLCRHFKELDLTEVYDWLIHFQKAAMESKSKLLKRRRL